MKFLRRACSLLPEKWRWNSVQIIYIISRQIIGTSSPLVRKKSPNCGDGKMNELPKRPESSGLGFFYVRSFAWNLTTTNTRTNRNGWSDPKYWRNQLILGVGFWGWKGSLWVFSSTNPRSFQKTMKTSRLIEAGWMMKIEIELASSNGYPQFINQMYPSPLAGEYGHKATEKLNLLKPENMIQLQFNVVVKRFDFAKHGKKYGFEEMNYISTLHRLLCKLQHLVRFWRCRWWQVRKSLSWRSTCHKGGPFRMIAAILVQSRYICTNTYLRVLKLREDIVGY